MIARVALIDSIQPLFDFTVVVQRDALASIGPAHVTDADEIGSGQTIRGADLHAEQGGLATEAHGADAEFVRGFQDVLLERIELRMGIAVFEFAEELGLAQFVTRSAIAADADAENAGAAAFALRLKDGVEDDLAAAIEIAIRTEVFLGQRVLSADVFAAASL
jgi:hypothetical protein